VRDVRDLEDVLSTVDCNIGVIAVPAQAAQAVAERLAARGVRALLNFAPASLHLREPVIVRNIDLAGELSILTHRLTFAQTAEAGYTG
jgi:redox-sensing transcriptional repressor